VCSLSGGIGTWSCPWDTSGLANGTYTLTAITTDAAGNARTTTTTVTVEHPVVTPPPTPPADPTPPTPPTPTPDTTAPVVTPKVPKAVTWAAAVKAVAGTLKVNEQSTVTVRLFVQPKDAKRLGLGKPKKPVLIGTAIVKGNGTIKFVVRPTRKGKTALGKLRAGTNVVLRLEATAVDTAGNKVVKKQNVTVKRPKPRRPRR
jgi:hypothetical protein